MKTMKIGSDVRRVVEKDVEKYLDNGYKFCKKAEWKILRDEAKVVKKEKESK